jgi:hypothetical protein
MLDHAPVGHVTQLASVAARLVPAAHAVQLCTVPMLAV